MMVICIVFLMQCNKDGIREISPISAEGNSYIYSDAQIAEYFKNFEYPEDYRDYKIQFVGNVHRDDLSPGALDKLLQREVEIAAHRALPIEVRKQKAMAKKQAIESAGAPMQIMTVYSITFWNVNDFDVDDWEYFDEANMMYGNQVYPWSTNPWEWGENTNFMTVYSTTIACASYLENYVDYSEIDTYDSDSEHSDCFDGAEVDNRILKPRAGEFGLDNILSSEQSPIDLQAISSWDRANLNPSFELYNGDVSGYPDAWALAITSPDNIPSLYNYIETASLVTRQSSPTPEHGSYINRIQARNAHVISNPKGISTAYFHIPESRQEEDDTYFGTIFVRSNNTNTSAKYAFSMTLYNDTGGIIGTDTRNCLHESGAWTENQISVPTTDVAPEWVRFSVHKTDGRVSDYFYFDNMMLSNVDGDISLPVEFTGITYSNYVTDYPEYRNIDVNWGTGSELNSWKFKLFHRRDGGSGAIEAVGPTEQAAAGSKSSSSTYSKRFALTASNAMTWMGVQNHIDVFIGCQDTNGTWEYFEANGVIVDYP